MKWIKGGWLRVNLDWGELVCVKEGSGLFRETHFKTTLLTIKAKLRFDLMLY